MRTISAGGLAKLAQSKGTEPIIILEVDWAPNATITYADRDIDTSVKGRILDVGDLDNVIDVLNSNSSQELSVTLDDTDGSIKDIMDNHDIHQRDVRVYQWFDGLALSDRFLLFAGKLSSPVSWSETNRSISFSVISQLEDKEFGFSAEEGQFPFLPKDLVGKPWPAIFGKVLDCPALQVNKAVSGSTLCGIGVLSGEDLHNQVDLGGANCSLGISLQLMSFQAGNLLSASSAWADIDPGKAADLLDQANQIFSQMASSAGSQATQQNCATTRRAQKMENAKESGLGCNPVRILGGEDFPQGQTIKLNINGGLFTGKMTNDSFNISKREHPQNDDKADELFNNQQADTCESPSPIQFFDFQVEVPVGRGNTFPTFTSTVMRQTGFIFCNTPTTSRPSAPQVAQHFWADSGSRVVIASDEPITYIVSIIPGTVLAVKAYKNLEGVRKLVNVPNSLWHAQVTNYNRGRSLGRPRLSGGTAAGPAGPSRPGGGARWQDPARPLQDARGAGSLGQGGGAAAWRRRRDRVRQ
jgi:hypothetical protein